MFSLWLSNGFAVSLVGVLNCAFCMVSTTDATNLMESLEIITKTESQITIAWTRGLSSYNAIIELHSLDQNTQNLFNDAVIASFYISSIHQTTHNRIPWAKKTTIHFILPKGSFACLFGFFIWFFGFKRSRIVSGLRVWKEAFKTCLMKISQILEIARHSISIRQ